jgi:hypothetical protein
MSWNVSVVYAAACPGSQKARATTATSTHKSLNLRHLGGVMGFSFKFARKSFARFLTEGVNGQISEAAQS